MTISFDRGYGWWRIHIGNAVLKWRRSMPADTVGIDLPGDRHVQVSVSKLEDAIEKLVAAPALYGAMPNAARSHKQGPRCDGRNCPGHPFNCYGHPYDCGCTTPETSRTDEGYDANGSPVADTVPPGHFWRGVPESNRHQCRNCGHHYDEHHHTDESSRCPL